MYPAFNKLFHEIEAQRLQMLDAVRPLTKEQLNKSVVDGKWSVSEILSHLITAERMSVQYMQKKIQGIDALKNSGVWDEVKINLLIVSQRLPGLKFKAPRRVVENTTPYDSLENITKAWDGVRAEFKTLLEEIPANRVNRRIYRHARVGYLNVKHALIFFREHIIHHTPQIRNLINHQTP